MTSPVRGSSGIEGRLLASPASLSPQKPALLPQTLVAGPRFSDALVALGRQIDAGERLTERALSPRLGQLDASELIALQAGIYRYSEAVDLAAKLVDRAGAAIKTTLQGQ
jgi:hypothetical protein